MRVTRVGDPGAEFPVALDGDGAYDLRGLTSDITADFLAGDWAPRVRDALDAGELPGVALDGLRVGAPVVRPGKVVCIGLNYRKHAVESGADIPEEPVVFMKASNTVVGPQDTVLIPRGSERTDYEVELAVVIGRTARYLPGPDSVPRHIAGYAVANDVSERAFQLERGGQWVKGKSCETFNPLGPWLVSPDEVGDPQDLRLRLWVNGERRQDSTTADMIFDVRHIVWYLSQFMVLEPGDVISTGTPSGVAMGSPDIPYLAEGDVVELEIDRLGRQRQRVARA
ncbi:fumarylacetoacetate hydrolase family protein [Streptomyces oceani]|uniref:2-hydroxyhepta-2,4-diene-1,7-dioate isomerase n=1 Tax=Streptomyces oceani TaxID=1075402 RepID=A0A1E7KJK1_9ACTN|nr:fumarylacetoacetate hydrolase family protein [Streptomyces oceani]OEV04139.1 2-hydroxyhepta-2,4-diene-1,7-dioate isomerase [Streptomyces oceani]